MPTGALSLGRRALPIALALLLAAPADGRAQPGEWLTLRAERRRDALPAGRRDHPRQRRPPRGRLELPHGRPRRRASARAAKLAFEATPILADGRLYLSTPFNRVIALDPASGRERWRFDARLDPRDGLLGEPPRAASAAWADARSGAGRAVRDAHLPRHARRAPDRARRRARARRAPASATAARSI